MPKQRTEKVAEKVFLAVDVNNLWHGCKELHGQQARVNFATLLKRVNAAGFKKVPREIRAVAYTITAPFRKTTPTGFVREESSRNKGFLAALEKIGYEVKTRHMRFEKGITKPFHTDWDVGITVDAVANLEWMDTFILASGDGDYSPLLRKVQDSGKRVEIYTFKNTAARVLYEQSNHVFYLDDSNVFVQRLDDEGGDQ